MIESLVPKEFSFDKRINPKQFNENYSQYQTVSDSVSNYPLLPKFNSNHDKVDVYDENHSVYDIKQTTSEINSNELSKVNYHRNKLNV